MLTGTACAAALAASATGTHRSYASPSAYVSASLLRDAQADPSNVFRVILQGAGAHGEARVVASAAASVFWDPLDQAVERLWFDGVRVVAAAGNPKWKPDQVEGAIMLSAKAEPNATPGSVGVGLVDVATAGQVGAPPNANSALDKFVHPGPPGSAAATADVAPDGP